MSVGDRGQSVAETTKTVPNPDIEAILPETMNR
jgi:hypothetical protein